MGRRFRGGELLRGLDAEKLRDESFSVGLLRVGGGLSSPTIEIGRCRLLRRERKELFGGCLKFLAGVALQELHDISRDALVIGNFVTEKLGFGCRLLLLQLRRLLLIIAQG